MILVVNPFYSLREMLFWGWGYVSDEVLKIKVRASEAPKLTTFAAETNIM